MTDRKRTDFPRRNALKLDLTGPPSSTPPGPTSTSATSKPPPVRWRLAPDSELRARIPGCRS
jgi:hypothetical protein